MYMYMQLRSCHRCCGSKPWISMKSCCPAASCTQFSERDRKEKNSQPLQYVDWCLLCLLPGLYLKKVLGYPADQASQLLQVWKATVYLTPLLGAYLADAVMGRFWVILVFSCIYFLVRETQVLFRSHTSVFNLRRAQKYTTVLTEVHQQASWIQRLHK